MTKKIILSAILAIALVFAMTVVGCGLFNSNDDDSTDDNGSGPGVGTGPGTGTGGSGNGQSRETAILLTENIWEEGDLNTREWFKFTATAANQIIHYEPGQIYVYVEIFDNTGKSITDTSMYSIGGSGAYPNQSRLYISQTLKVGSVYYIHVYKYQIHGGTAFRIGFNKSTTLPVEKSVILPTNVTTLTVDTWSKFTVNTATSTSYSEKWFKFTATATYQYIHFNKDGYSTGETIYLYDSTGASIYTRIKAAGPVQLTIGKVYYFKVYFEYNGTYKVAFNTSSTPPPESEPSVILPTTNITQLTANTWADGFIANSSGEQWFKFTATVMYQYIHFSPGTLPFVRVQLYDDSGIILDYRDSSGTLLYASNNLETSRTVTIGREYYIKVVIPYNDYSGTYRIKFNTAAKTTDLPTEGVTTLTAGVYANGNIDKGGQWFKFTATAATQYIYFNPGTLTGVVVTIWDDIGVFEANSNNLFGSTPFLFTLTTGKEYYMAIGPYSSSSSGTYMIGFTASSTTRPELPEVFITLPTENITTLTANTWADGVLVASGSEQWFKFTATAATQYIHTAPDFIYVGVYVQLYKASGAEFGNRRKLDDSTRYTSLTLTIDSEYYIKVTPSGIDGTYQIAFNTSTSQDAIIVTLPTENITTLTASVYTNGNISGMGGNWFKFTATAATQYIYYAKGTLNSDGVMVQFYDSNGTKKGGAFLYGTGNNAIYNFNSVTINSEYYIRVSPYNYKGTGTYKIGFTASSTTPPTS